MNSGKVGHAVNTRAAYVGIKQGCGRGIQFPQQGSLAKQRAATHASCRAAVHSRQAQAAPRRALGRARMGVQSLFFCVHPFPPNPPSQTPTSGKPEGEVEHPRQRLCVNLPWEGGHRPSAALHMARCTATDNALHHRRAQPWPAAARRMAVARHARSRMSCLSSRCDSSFQRPPTLAVNTHRRSAPPPGEGFCFFSRACLPASKAKRSRCRPKARPNAHDSVYGVSSKFRVARKIASRSGL